MVGTLRAITAGKFLDGIKKFGSSRGETADALSHTIQWGLRIEPVPKKPQDSNTVSVGISHKYLKSQGLLPEMKSQEVSSWSDDVAKMVMCDGVIKSVELSQGKLVASIAAGWFTKNLLSTIYEAKEKYGMQSILHNYKASNDGLEKVKGQQTVVVEFSSPNIAKPFHAGHLRSTVLGSSIARLYRALGHDVTTINYLGDWGTQFGYLGVGFSKHGSEEKLVKSPMEHLFDVYVKAHSDAKEDESFHTQAINLFAQMEAGDERSLAFWQKCRDMSVEEYQKTYQRLGVDFDCYDGESQYQTVSKDVVLDMEQRGLLNTHERTGVKYMDLTDVEDDKKNPKYVNVLKSDGTSLYITRDIAAFADRKERYGFDRLIYVVDNSQDNHFKQLILSCRKLGLISPGEPQSVRGYHLPFGRVEGMSTRRGEVVFLTQILDEATARMKEIMLSKESTKVQEPDAVDYTANILAVSGLIFQDLCEHRNKGYKFSWDRVLSFKGNTGPFVQYQHARMCSLLRTMSEQMSLVPSLNVNCDLLIGDLDALRLIVCLAKFDEAVMKSYADLEPHFIANYILDLCHLSSKALSVLSVKQSSPEVAQARLLLFDCARQTLSNGLKLLGITPLERM